MLKDVSLEKYNIVNKLWTKCKCKGPIISNRSYHSATHFKDKYFTYNLTCVGFLFLEVEITKKVLFLNFMV